MYLETFGLKMFPFANTADPRFFFASDAHEEALANMTYAIEQGKGMVMVTGEVGTGKTLVANILGLRLRRTAQILHVTDPLVRGDQLMRFVHQELMGTVAKRQDRLTIQAELRDRLIGLTRMGRRVAVLVDECQDLSKGALEQLRLMSNWEYRAEKLIQWVLIGQPELRDRIGLPEWEHLRQRIALSYHLVRMPLEMVGPYIAHRLQIAAGGEEPNVSFEPEAVEQIAKATKGAPRLINNICDSALLLAFGSETHRVTAQLVDTVVREMSVCGWGNEVRFADKTYRLPAAKAG